MAFEFQRYDERLVPAVKEFNQRMRAGGVGIEFMIPESVQPLTPPVTSEWTLVTENDTVRGGYIVQSRPFLIGGERRVAGDYQSPISEGIINKRYAMVGALMIKHALRSNPWLYTVGMGGLERPLPRMLKAMGWSLTTVPFRFHVARPGRFLREIQHLRTSGARRAALDLAALSGAGWLGVRGVAAWRSRGGEGRPAAGQVERFDDFGAWADELWKQHADDYRLAGFRDAVTLNALYSGPRFRRWKLMRQGRTIGWVVTLTKQLRENKYFGNMLTGVLVDAWAPLADSRWAIQTGARGLREEGVDLILANTLHPSWLEALRQECFLHGPTNFGFAVSPEIAKVLEPFEQQAATKVFLMRGDGDGLANFLS